MQARAATWQLAQELGRTPTESDLATSLGVSSHDLRDAQLAEMAFQPSSLDTPLSGEPDSAMLTDLLGKEDPQMDHMLDMQAVATHWGELPAREQEILLMRFYDEMTQDQIGQQLGISQMQVSRLLGNALRYLRRAYSGLTSPQPPDEPPSAQGGCRRGTNSEPEEACHPGPHRPGAA